MGQLEKVAAWREPPGGLLYPTLFVERHLFKKQSTCFLPKKRLPECDVCHHISKCGPPNDDFLASKHISEPSEHPGQCMKNR